MTKGQVVRFIGGFCLAFGLVGLCTPGGRVQTDMLLLAVGILFTFCGFGQP